MTVSCPHQLLYISESKIPLHYLSGPHICTGPIPCTSQSGVRSLSHGFRILPGRGMGMAMGRIKTLRLLVKGVFQCQRQKNPFFIADINFVSNVQVRPTTQSRCFLLRNPPRPFGPYRGCPHHCQPGGRDGIPVLLHRLDSPHS